MTQVLVTDLVALEHGLQADAADSVDESCQGGGGGASDERGVRVTLLIE